MTVITLPPSCVPSPRDSTFSRSRKNCTTELIPRWCRPPSHILLLYHVAGSLTCPLTLPFLMHVVEYKLEVSIIIVHSVVNVMIVIITEVHCGIDSLILDCCMWCDKPFWSSWMGYELAVRLLSSLIVTWLSLERNYGVIVASWWVFSLFLNVSSDMSSVRSSAGRPLSK